jgi:hypothetical protein
LFCTSSPIHTCCTTIATENGRWVDEDRRSGHTSRRLGDKDRRFSDTSRRLPHKSRRFTKTSRVIQKMRGHIPRLFFAIPRLALRIRDATFHFPTTPIMSNAELHEHRPHQPHRPGRAGRLGRSSRLVRLVRLSDCPIGPFARLGRPQTGLTGPTGPTTAVHTEMAGHGPHRTG